MERVTARRFEIVRGPSMGKPGLADLMLTSLSALERLVLTPLFAWKRSTGWRRRGLSLLYLTIAPMVGVLGGRAVSFSRLPNSPEPFDLAKYGRVEVPDADNAMVAYRSVIAKFGDLDAKGYSPASQKAWNVTDWSVADPEVRRWVEDHRAALAAWLPATDLTDSLLAQ